MLGRSPLPCGRGAQGLRRPGQLLGLGGVGLGGSSAWVLSGSLCGWGDPLIPEFELVLFLAVPTPVRLARLREREALRYGQRAIRPGGALHGAHAAFLDWAGRYDAGGLEMRSRALHEAWLATLPCRVIRLEGELSVAEQLSRIRAALAAAF